LCKKFQATIFSLQEECTRVTVESSALLDDFFHHWMSDEVHIISDPNIPKFPPCVTVEEHPPCEIAKEHPPSPKATKKKDILFVSTLPRRGTRSMSSIKASVGWKDMELAIPILHPLSSIVKETATQELFPSNNMVVT
jgi:hypothetical protein